MCPHNTTLIRLHSLTGDGVFDNMFQEELIIQPKSKIAIQSASFIKPDDTLVIDSGNDEISFQIGTGTKGQGVISITLSHATYTKTNIEDFLQEISDKMNKKLKISKTIEHGTQVQAFLNEDERIEFQFYRHGVNKFIEEQLIDGGANPYFEKVGSIIQTDDPLPEFTTNTIASLTTQLKNYFYYGNPFTAGCGKVRAVVRKFQNTDPAVVSGMLIGLVSTEHLDKLRGGTITLDDIEYYVRTNVDGLHTSAYQSFPADNGSVVPSNVTNTGDGLNDYNNNDIMEIQLDEGFIKFAIHKQSNPQSTTFLRTDLPYPYESESATGTQKTYLPFFAVFGNNATTELLAPVVDLDPYKSDEENLKNIRFTSDNVGVSQLGLPPFGFAVGEPSVRNLIFGDPDLALALGFENIEQNAEGEESDGTENTESDYVADNGLTKFLGTNTFLFELLNLKVNSYDSYNESYKQNPLAMMGGRRNILSAIMVNEGSSQHDNRVYFEPANLIFIDLQNPSKISLRTLKARLVSHDYASISVSGMSEVTLLLQQENEDK